MILESKDESQMDKKTKDDLKRIDVEKNQRNSKSHQEENSKSNIWLCVPESKMYIIGIFYTIIHTSLKATMASTSKLSTLQAPMIATVTSCVTSIAGLSIALPAKAPIFGKDGTLIWLMIRGVSGAAAFIAMLYSYKFIPVTEATVIALSSPLFGMTFARIFLSEPFGIYEGIMLLFTIIGVLVVINPLDIIYHLGTDAKVMDQVIGCSLSLAHSLIWAFMVLVLRKLRGCDAGVLMFWGGFMTVLIAGTLTILAELYGAPVSVTDIFVTGATAFSGASALLFLTLGLRYATVSQVMLVSSVEVIFAALYQILLFQDGMTISTIVGSILICLSVILISVKESILQKLCDIKSKIKRSCVIEKEL